MDKILAELDVIFKMISTIPVSGDSVEIMATAKNKLRQVYAEVKQKAGEEGQRDT